MNIIAEPNYDGSIFNGCLPMAAGIIQTLISQPQVIFADIFEVLNILWCRNKSNRQWTTFIGFSILLKFDHRRRVGSDLLKIAYYSPVWGEMCPWFVT